jgi:transcriptional regulator with XRE-family HTH domain
MYEINSEIRPSNGAAEALFTHAKSSAHASKSEPEAKPADGAEENIRRVLSEYELGTKLRHLRLRKKIALTDLGRHTGLSASMLSQLENGKLVPTLPTLARIATAFEIGLDYFFTEKRERRLFSIVRADERAYGPEAQGVPVFAHEHSPVPGHPFELLTTGIPNRNMSAYMAEFGSHEKAAEAREHAHEGSEFIHVLEGELAIHYQAEQHVLRAGDSAYFDASEAHSYSGNSETPAKAIVVTLPPRL